MVDICLVQDEERFEVRRRQGIVIARDFEAGSLEDSLGCSAV